MHLTDFGPAGLPAAVVAPGVGSRAAFVADCFAAALAARGLRLVTYDLTGTVLRDPAEHGPARHAERLAAAAAEVGARVVGGISLGGLAALRAVADGLAVDGVLVALPAPLPVPAGPADDVERYGVPEVLARMTGALPWVRDEVAAAWSAYDPGTLVAALRAVATEPPWRPAVVDVPVGIAAATDDPAHPYQAAVDLAAALPRATVTATSLAAMARDRGALGAAAVSGLR